MNKINISTGNELYRDIEQIVQNRLSSQTFANVRQTFYLSLIFPVLFSYMFQVYSNPIGSNVFKLFDQFSRIPLIFQAANDYIDSSKNGQDKNILLAK